MDRKKLELADDILGAILGANAFDDFMGHDAGVSAADKAVAEALNAVAEYVPVEAMGRLRDSIAGISAAYSQCGTVYGLYVAATMREAVTCPTELSRYVMERVEKARVDE